MDLLNSGNSCYLDSLIVAMFTYKHSPFVKQINQSSSEIAKELRKVIKTKSNSSIGVRNLLPEHIRHGQHDPSEVYNYFITLFEYDPIEIKTIRQVKQDENSRVYKKKSIKQSLGLFPIESNVKEFQEILIPEWEKVEVLLNNSKDIPTYSFTRNLTFFTRADCFVFYYNRCNGEAYKNETNLDMPLYIDNEDAKYFRYAVICHLGRNVHYGHYICVIYENVDEEQFVIFDDNSTELKIVKNTPEFQKFVNTNGVMYFYYK